MASKLGPVYPDIKTLKPDEYFYDGDTITEYLYKQKQKEWLALKDGQREKKRIYETYHDNGERYNRNTQANYEDFYRVKGGDGKWIKVGSEEDKKQQAADEERARANEAKKTTKRYKLQRRRSEALRSSLDRDFDNVYPDIKTLDVASVYYEGTSVTVEDYLRRQKNWESLKPGEWEEVEGSESRCYGQYDCYMRSVQKYRQKGQSTRRWYKRDEIMELMKDGSLSSIPPQLEEGSESYDSERPPQLRF